VRKLSITNIRVSYLNTLHRHIILVSTAPCILPNTTKSWGIRHPSHSSSTRAGNIRSHSTYTRGYSGNIRWPDRNTSSLAGMIDAWTYFPYPLRLQKPWGVVEQSRALCCQCLVGGNSPSLRKRPELQPWLIREGLRAGSSENGQCAEKGEDEDWEDLHCIESRRVLSGVLARLEDNYRSQWGSSGYWPLLVSDGIRLMVGIHRPFIFHSSRSFPYYSAPSHTLINQLDYR